MRVDEVDERTSSWEDGSPVFRVYFHHTVARSDSEMLTPSDDHDLAWSTVAYDVRDADVLQVIDWAQRSAAPDRVWSVALVGLSGEAVHYGGEPAQRLGLTWLIGMDGIDTPRWAGEGDRHHRMWRRRDAPVVIPAEDRAPDGVPLAVSHEQHR